MSAGIDFLSKYLPANYSLCYATDKDAMYLQVICKDYPEETICLRKEVNKDHIIKYAVDALNIYIYLLDKEVFKHLYELHGNGD